MRSLTINVNRPARRMWIGVTLAVAATVVTACTIAAAHPSQEKVLYLTFDDGPGSATPEVLNVLRANNAKATFFTIGRNLSKPPSWPVRSSPKGMSSPATHGVTRI